MRRDEIEAEIPRAEARLLALVVPSMTCMTPEVERAYWELGVLLCMQSRLLWGYPEGEDA